MYICIEYSCASILFLCCARIKHIQTIFFTHPLRKTIFIMPLALSELVIDEALFVEISTAFNEHVCVPLYRNGAEFGLKLQDTTAEILANLNRLCEVHKSLHNALKSAPNDDHDMSGINAIFERYGDELKKIDIDFMAQTYGQIEELFELSYKSSIINMMRKFNFEHNFNDIAAASTLSYYKEEPQFIAYMLYLSSRIYRYLDHYHIAALNKLKPKCMQLYDKIESALYLLCLQRQITQCPFQLFTVNRVLIRLEKLNMEAGKFKKKQKKRLLVLFSDKIVWCSILQHATKKGEKYKYKGSYRIKDEHFAIKPFYYDSNDDNHETYDAYENESMPLPVANQHFGFKFGLDGNDKSFKMIVCTETQQQFWCKDMNKYIMGSSAHVSHINLQNIELFERFLKHATSWKSDKIWHKMLDKKACHKSLLRIILSLFYDLVVVHHTVHPPPILSSSTPGGVTKGGGTGTDDDDDLSTASFSETTQTVSNQSHRSSLNELNDWSETKTLKQEMEQLKSELNKLKNKYKIIQNENVKLSARNAFLNQRVTVFNQMFAAANSIMTDAPDHEEDMYLENDADDAAKYMKMISHKRKNSDSTLFNKSPSFLSTVNDSQIQKDPLPFYLDSKSRNEIIYRHKKKPKKKPKHRKSDGKTRNAKLTQRSKTTKMTLSQDDTDTQSNPSDF
eukprot:828216_1